MHIFPRTLSIRTEEALAYQKKKEEALISLIIQIVIKAYIQVKKYIYMVKKNVMGVKIGETQL